MKRVPACWFILASVQVAGAAVTTSVDYFQCPTPENYCISGYASASFKVLTNGPMKGGSNTWVAGGSASVYARGGSTATISETGEPLPIPVYHGSSAGFEWRERLSLFVPGPVRQGSVRYTWELSGCCIPEYEESGWPRIGGNAQLDGAIVATLGLSGTGGNAPVILGAPVNLAISYFMSGSALIYLPADYSGVARLSLTFYEANGSAAQGLTELPEPSTYTMLGLGLASLALRRSTPRLT